MCVGQNLRNGILEKAYKKSASFWALLVQRLEESTVFRPRHTARKDDFSFHTNTHTHNELQVPSARLLARLGRGGDLVLFFAVIPPRLLQALFLGFRCVLFRRERAVQSLQREVRVAERQRPGRGAASQSVKRWQAFFQRQAVHHRSRCSMPYTFRHFLPSPRGFLQDR